MYFISEMIDGSKFHVLKVWLTQPNKESTYILCSNELLATHNTFMGQNVLAYIVNEDWGSSNRMNFAVCRLPIIYTNSISQLYFATEDSPF